MEDSTTNPNVLDLYLDLDPDNTSSGSSLDDDSEENEMWRYLKRKHISSASITSLETKRQMIQYFLDCTVEEKEALAHMRQKVNRRYLYKCPCCARALEIHAYGWCYDCKQWRCKNCQRGAWRSDFCYGCEDDHDDDTDDDDTIVD